MLVLGINGFFEHPSIALIEDGEVIFAAEDERFTGIKHGRSYSPFSGYLPYAAIYQGLEYTGKSAKEISEIAYSYSKWEHLRSLSGCFTGKRISSFRDEFSAFITLCNLPHSLRSEYEIPRRFEARLKASDFAKTPFREWPHHLCHAASTFYFSDFEEALIVVADGAGEKACTSVYSGKNGKINRIAAHNLPNSLGHFYSYITAHLGFQPFADEFKVMGLAAYGEPRYIAELEQLIRLVPGGRYELDLARVQRLGDYIPEGRGYGAEITQEHKDIARSAQVILENAIIHIVRHHMNNTGHKKVCLAGGVFLNCILNGKLAQLSEVEDVFVQPAASDAGTALGAAALSTIDRGGVVIPCKNMALGTSCSTEKVASIINQTGLEFEAVAEKDATRILAAKLADNCICAVFRGRMEFGPRALGMRSLLASPTIVTMRDVLNEVKGREDFRPIAPIVTREAFSDYFIGHKDPYMLFGCQSTPFARGAIPSAIHVDGTSRVQTVSEKDDSFMYRLLKEFGTLSGHPVILNTSFNIKGKPIVESPEEALLCLLTTRIDYLYIEGFLVKKPGVRAMHSEPEVRVAAL